MTEAIGDADLDEFSFTEGRAVEIEGRLVNYKIKKTNYSNIYCAAASPLRPKGKHDGAREHLPPG
jgi:hypothetical protein